MYPGKCLKIKMPYIINNTRYFHMIINDKKQNIFDLSRSYGFKCDTDKNFAATS